jgi:hypothetical protein
MMQFQSQSDVAAEASNNEALQRYIRILEQAIDDVKTSCGTHEHFLPNVHNLEDEVRLQQLRSHFHRVLRSTKNNWVPQGNLIVIIRACVNEQCKERLTIDFYRHGGIPAVVALYKATLHNTWAFSQISALSEERRDILVEEVKGIKVNDLVLPWIEKCDRDPSMALHLLSTIRLNDRYSCQQ